MNGFIRDFGQAMRALRRARGFGVISIGVFAIAIGATTAIFTLIQRVVLDPLPYPEADRLVRIKSPVSGVGPGAEWQLSAAQLRYFQANVRGLDEIGAYRSAGANVQTPEGARRVTTAAAQASTLRILGARPVLGRVLGALDDDAGAPAVAMLSEGFWRRAFGAQRSVVGSTITINERAYEVVGVAADGLRLPDEPGAGLSLGTDVWVPFGPTDNVGRSQYSHTFPAIGRMAPGTTLAQAQAEMTRLTAQLEQAYPDYYVPEFFERWGFSTKVYSLKAYVLGEVARNLWVLFGGVGLVLAIACLNVANLFLVRIEGRRREIAVRTALGAGRRLIARQFLAESAVIALSGGVIAVALGWWGVDWLVALAPDSVPRLAELHLGGGSVLFTLGVSVLLACFLAAFPIVQYRRGARAGMLIDGGRTMTSGRERQRVRSGLVAAQVALAFVLLVGAGLLVNSFERLRSVDAGVDSEGVLTMALYLPPVRYATADAAWRFYSELLDRIERIPGVTRAGLSEELPLTGAYGCTVQGFEDAAVYDRIKGDGSTTCAGQEATSPGFIEALGVRLIGGRTLTTADNDQPGTGSVVVSQAFAENFWPGENPIGKGVAPNGWTDQPFYRVVGVVGDVRSASLDEPPALVVYYPIVHIPSENRRPWWPGEMALVVRTSLADPASVFPAVRAAIADLDPGIPLANAEPMAAIVERSMGRLAFTTTLLGIASLIALILAAVGLYGVIAYIVSRRTRELGVRVALGAQPAQVESLVIGGSLRMVGAGLLGGVVVALAVTRLMRGMLYGVEATDPLTYLVAIAVLGAVGLVASWIPARRAARVDPMVAMRTE